MTDLKTETIEILDPAQVGLRVQFQRLSDRWAHQVFWLVPQQAPQLVLASLEGGPNEPWPPSPPFQELVVQPESRSAGPVAMLLGRAGTAHWSASFELGLRPVRAIIDVACRISAAPHFAGSSYRSTAPISIDSLDQPLIKLAKNAGWLLHAKVETGVLPDGLESQSVWVIRPLPQDPPATLRWRYQVQVA